MFGLEIKVYEYVDKGGAGLGGSSIKDVALIPALVESMLKALKKLVQTPFEIKDIIKSRSAEKALEKLSAFLHDLYFEPTAIRLKIKLFCEDPSEKNRRELSEAWRKSKTLIRTAATLSGKLETGFAARNPGIIRHIRTIYHTKGGLAQFCDHVRLPNRKGYEMSQADLRRLFRSFDKKCDEVNALIAELQEQIALRLEEIGKAKQAD